MPILRIKGLRGQGQRGHFKDAKFLFWGGVCVSVCACMWWGYGKIIRVMQIN